MLFVQRDAVPAETRAALQRTASRGSTCSGRPRRSRTRSSRRCGKLGTVTRIGGGDPVRSSIDFARFTDGSFGWGVVDPGHGLVFARTDRPLDAAAAAPLSASGTYGPLLLVSNAGHARRSRSTTTCSTSSRATARIRCAASTITAGSSGTTRRSRWGSRRGSTSSSRSPASRSPRRVAVLDRHTCPKPSIPIRRSADHAVTRRRRPPAHGRLDAALRAADPQPDRAADRRAARRRPRPGRGRARDRAPDEARLHRRGPRRLGRGRAAAAAVGLRRAGAGVAKDLHA